MTYMAIVGEFHVLCKIQALDRGDIPQIKEPDIGEDLAFKDKPSHDTAEDVDIDLQIGSGIDESQLGDTLAQHSSRDGRPV